MDIKFEKFSDEEINQQTLELHKRLTKEEEANLQKMAMSDIYMSNDKNFMSMNKNEVESYNINQKLKSLDL